MGKQQQETHADAVEQLEEGLLDGIIAETTAPPRQYIAKMELRQGQKRDLADVKRRFLQEASLAGESFYYGWGVGKDKVQGPSIKCAMSAARCWGNCTVEMLPMQETADAYVFTARFVDFETGFTLERQFRQSKRWIIYGKMDAERKEDVRFQIGQSKAARNLVLNALPEWMIDEAVDAAKMGVRAKVEKYIEANGKVKAAQYVLRDLAKEGVPEKRALSKMGVAKLEGLTVDDIVMLRGNLKAIQDGSDSADAIFGSDEPDRKPLADLKAPTEQDPTAREIDSHAADETVPSTPDDPLTEEDKAAIKAEDARKEAGEKRKPKQQQELMK